MPGHAAEVVTVLIRHCQVAALIEDHARCAELIGDRPMDLNGASATTTAGAGSA